MRRASRVVTQLYDEALQPSGIRSTQFAVLVAIAKMEPITVSGLEVVLAIDSTTLSRSLRKLEQMGLLKMARGRDQRERLGRLSAKGRRVLEKSVPYWRKVQGQVVSRLKTPGWGEIQKQLEYVKNVSEGVLKSRDVKMA